MKQFHFLLIRLHNYIDMYLLKTVTLDNAIEEFSSWHMSHYTMLNKYGKQANA